MDAKTKVAIYAGVGITLTVGLWIWYGFGLRDNGTGINPVRNELEQAGAEQQKQAVTLERAENAITGSEETNRGIQNLERDDAEIIGECQQILERIRKRNETQAESERPAETDMASR